MQFNIVWFRYAQLALLLVIFLFLIVTVPQFWIQYPDSGVYLGSTQSILESGKYWFNYQPNLLYYPGTSTVLLIPLALVGENYAVLQGFMVAISLLGIFFISRYFNLEKYGVIGLFTPFFVLFSSIYIIHYNAMLSDTIFLTITFAALLCWRKYQTEGNAKYLLLCALLVAFSSLTRLQGVFLCAAFGLALIAHFYQNNRGNLVLPFGKAAIIGGLTCLPFVVWTMRNYLLYTPDTYNMVNDFFFGLSGLRLYAENLTGNINIDPNMSGADYTIYRVTIFFSSLFESWYGIISQTNRKIITFLILLLSSIGLFDWYNRASKLERLYVFISFLYIVKDLTKANHLYVVDRYWIPLLPFIVVFIGFGINRLVSLQLLSRWRRAMQLTATSMALVLLFIASPNLIKPLQDEERLRSEQSSIDNLSLFVDQNISKDAVFATLDWGVLPHTLQRKSFPIMNDPTTIQNIARMKKYNINYLVSYAKYGSTDAAARALIETYPEAFENIYSVNEDIPRARVTLYKVNLAMIPNN